MKYLRNDNHVTYCGADPVDMNDRDSERSAIELSLPEGFSEKAWACWNYFDGTAFLYEYKGRLVMTDESLYLTEHGDGSRQAPWGAPRGIFDSWEEVEAWLEAVYDDLEDDYEIV